jgi:hypothetical protein
MSCINKADKGYKALANIYGDALAEAFVRSYPGNKSGENVDFYIPSSAEVKTWLTQQKSNISKNVKRALEINPYMSEDAIKSMLKGVISKYKGTYFVTTGWLFSGSQAVSKETFNTVYKPNLAIMEGLLDKFPDIFTLRGTKNTNTVVVEITPREKPEEEEVVGEEEPVTSDLTRSVETYKSLVEQNNGLKPKMFMSGTFKWALNKNGLYNLIASDNDMVFLKNVDLETGTIVPEIEPVSAPLDEARRDRMFRSIMNMIKTQNLNDYLAEKGIDTLDIYESLRDAKTEADLNKINETLLNALC